MFKNREFILEKISLIFQVMISLACFTAIWWIRKSPYDVQTESKNELIYPLIMIAFMWFILLRQFGLGKIILSDNNSQFISYLKIITIGVWILFVINFISSYSTLEKENLLLFGVSNLFVLVVYKKSFYTVMRFIRSHGNGLRHILIIAEIGRASCRERV